MARVRVSNRERYAIVDDALFGLACQYRWKESRGHVQGKPRRPDGKAPENQKSVYMHRLFMGPWEKSHIDHKNHDGFDNRLSNLRWATFSQNRMNSPTNARNKLGYKGIFKAENGRFRVRVTQHYIGTFDTLAEAREAYNRKAKELYGEFAYQHNCEESLFTNKEAA